MKFHLILCFLFLVSFQCVSCADTYLSPDWVQEAYNSADAVFIGEIEDIQVARRRFFVFPAEYTLMLSVKKAWKGVSKENVVIRTGGHRGDCGSAFKKGESWLAIAVIGEQPAWLLSQYSQFTGRTVAPGDDENSPANTRWPALMGVFC